MQFITLGIGTPADVAHFVLVGLSPTGPIANVDDRVTTANAYFRRVATSAAANVRRSSATAIGTVRRTMTTEDGER